tara:strand:- start:50 stop:337 length:288 start_codon:yes stop_codon:yes gene_type:complete
MNSTSKALIKNLNDRILAQSVIVETLIDIIIDNNLITEKELTELILENQESQTKYLEELKDMQPKSISVITSTQDNTEISETLLEGLYFGPVGEA